MSPRHVVMGAMYVLLVSAALLVAASTRGETSDAAFIAANVLTFPLSIVCFLVTVAPFLLVGFGYLDPATVPWQIVLPVYLAAAILQAALGATFCAVVCGRRRAARAVREDGARAARSGGPGRAASAAP